MKNPLNDLFNQKRTSIHIFGLPGTYKTTFFIQAVWKKLEEGVDQIYLIDTSGTFPIIRLKPIKHLLNKLIIFHPKTIKEEAILLDDLSIQVLSSNSILLVDDVLRHYNQKNRHYQHLSSYILAQIQFISRRLDFPVIISNQARSYDNAVHPFLQSLILQYSDLHLLFERSLEPAKLVLSVFDQQPFVSQHEYKINSSGFLNITT